jgi:alpha-2-macroglobulin
VPLLIELAGADSARLDSSLAAAAAADVLVDQLKLPADGVPPNNFAPERYQARDGGLALLPYSSSDLELTTLAALVGPERFDDRRMAAYLSGVAADREETRERHVIALAGLAALGEPVLPELRVAAEDPNLTIRERLFVGIGAARIGDAGMARSIAAELIGTYGEQTAGQVRLRVGKTAVDSTEATAFAAVLAASVGDRRAPLLWASVEANPSPEAIFGLQAVAYGESTLAWLDSVPARFAWTVDGKRTVVDLAPGGASSFTVTATQLAGLTIERLDGEVAVTTTWREPVAASALTPDPDVSITRRVSPIGPITAGDLVRVDIVVAFGPHATADCHMVTDHVPSGLVPVGNVAAWIDPNAEAALPDAGAPYAQGDQLVRWCAAPASEDQTIELRYFARVITPGTYVWQPAVVSASTAMDRASVTAETRIQIR